MIIKRLTAAFGKLNNDTLTLMPGFNIITAPNEAGKSTWCAFLRAMLYGVPTSDRDKRGYLSDKTRYRPWSGAPMEGEIELFLPEYGEITISRSGTVKAPMREFRAVFTGTGEPVPGLTSENAGLFLTGVPEQVFSRSVFTAQSGVKIANTPELERRISALVSTGDEALSYSEADERLRSWLRRRKHNKNGEIPALEARISELDYSLERLESASEHTARLRQNLRDTERETDLLERELSYYDASDAQEKAGAAKRRLDEITAAESELLTRLDTALTPETLSDYRGELSALASLKLVRDAERQRLGTVRAKLDSLSEMAETSVFDRRRVDRATEELIRLTRTAAPSKLLKTVLAAAAIALILIAIFTDSTTVRLLSSGTAIFAAILLAAVLLRDGINIKRRNRLLAGFDSHSLSELREKLNNQAALLSELKQTHDAYSAAEQVSEKTDTLYNSAYETLAAKLPPRLAALLPDTDGTLREISALEDALQEYARLKSEKSAAEEQYTLLLAEATQRRTDLPKPRLSRADTEAELKRAAKKLELCRTEYDMALGAQQSLGDPIVLRSCKNELAARLSELNTQYDALSLAIDALGRANTELQTRFSPLLNGKAAAYLSKLTGGKYDRLVFSKDFLASVKTPDDTLSRDALSLSQGTADQIYLALRLAISELATEKNNCPLILDDALVSFDDSRLRYALSLLLELSEYRQIVLLTCHDREAVCAAELSGSVNIINL